MKNEIIKSIGSSIFTQPQLLVVYIVLTVIGFVSPFSILKSASLLIWVLVFVKKDLKINVEDRSFKDGLLVAWKTLSEDGYLSVVRKINKSTKKISEIKVLWVTDGKSKQIYGPRDLEDAESMALYLAESWDCRAYLPHRKTWLKE